MNRAGSARAASARLVGSGASGGGPPLPPPLLGLTFTTARIEPGAPPGWPGGVKLAMSTVYFRQPVSSEPSVTTASVGDVQLTGPGSKLDLVTLLALNRPAKLIGALDTALGDALPVAFTS